jgi:ElaB/YqjD/DUF883 family membrane-anchored ribosome-binding protein
MKFNEVSNEPKNNVSGEVRKILDNLRKINSYLSKNVNDTKKVLKELDFESLKSLNSHLQRISDKIYKG